MLRIKDVMTPQAEVISPDATAEDAAAIMKTLDIGVLPVSDEQGLVGILTDRDLVVRVMAATRDPKAMLVGEAMTPSVVYCFEDDGVEHAARMGAGFFAVAMDQLQRADSAAHFRPEFNALRIAPRGDLAAERAGFASPGDQEGARARFSVEEP